MRTTTPPRRDERGWRGGRLGPGPRRTVRRRGQLGARPSYMPARGRRGGGFPIWLGILLLIALGVILWLFLKGDVFTDDTPSGSTGTTGAEAPADATAGTITVGGEDLLGLAGEGNDALVDLEGQEVTADAVVVQGVLGDEAFWVGTDLDHRILVGLESGTPAASIEAGDRVSFQGTVEPLPLDFVDRYGVPAGEDTDLLLAQGHFVRTANVSTA